MTKINLFWLWFFWFILISLKMFCGSIIFCGVGWHVVGLNNFFLYSDSAIHFGAYLQLVGLLLDEDNGNYGSIEQATLLLEFSNNYQPRFHSTLELSGLLNTLLKYRVITKNRSRESTLVRVCKHPYPQSKSLCMMTYY